MSESEKIRRLREQTSALRASAERAHLQYIRSIRELDNALEEQPPAPRGFHEDS